MAKGINKLEFALRFGIDDTEWEIPRYIQEGLKWLAQKSEETSSSTPIGSIVEETLIGKESPRIAEIIDD